MLAKNVQTGASSPSDNTHIDAPTGAVIHRRIADPPVMQESYSERWEGEDKGLICAWLVGIEKAIHDPALASKALNGELPVLPFKGGLARKLKIKTKIGALHYLAMWQGLRGEDLHIDMSIDTTHTCTMTGMPVIFTMDYARLMSAEALDNGE